MINRNKSDQNSQTPVCDIWEVRLAKTVFQRVRQNARHRKCTMSWIVRYCVLRLINKPGLNRRVHLDEILDEIRQNQPPVNDCHRFYLCLYGEDDLLLRLAARRLGITVSMLIRLALYRYLRILEKIEAVPAWRFFWFGIKLNRNIVIKYLRNERHIVKDFLISKKFNYEDYWDIPDGPLPRFFFTA